MTTFTTDDRKEAEKEPIPFAGWIQHSDDTVTKAKSLVEQAPYQPGYEDAVPQMGRVSAWIPVSERLPDNGQNVAFIVKSDLHDYLDGRILGGRYTTGISGGFSVPGMHCMASHWMPLPDAPILKKASEK